MFRRKRPSVSNQLDTDISQSDTTIQHLSQDHRESPTWVYVWTMTRDTLGHAAIQVGGNSPKMTEEDEGDYISIHPRHIPAAGPTTILPLPAESVNSLSEDMDIAVPIDKRISDLDITPPKKPSSESLPPDHTFKIEGLDTHAMKARIDEIKKQMKSGKSAYQLLPNVNTVGFMQNFMRDSAAFISQDPIDVSIHMRNITNRKPLPQIQKYNCSTLAGEILNAGGMKMTTSNTPWCLSPNELAEQLQQKENTKLKR